jgi:hypothetical protein
MKSWPAAEFPELPEDAMFPPRLCAAVPAAEPPEAEIRAYARDLLAQATAPGAQEADHWNDARACLLAHIPRRHAATWLRRRRHAAGSATAPRPDGAGPESVRGGPVRSFAPVPLLLEPPGLSGP